MGGSGSGRPTSADSLIRKMSLPTFVSPPIASTNEQMIIPNLSGVQRVIRKGNTGTNKVFYSDADGVVQELALGAAATVLTSSGAATAPTFSAVSGGHVIKDEGGADLTARRNLNFTGAGVTATDNAGTNSTDITIAGGGGSGLPVALYYGAGSDGAVTIAGNTTLTQPGFYTTLTVNNGVTLTTGNYPIYASTSVTNNGTISCAGGDGNNAVGATKGIAGTTPGSGTSRVPAAGGGGNGGDGKIVAAGAAGTNGGGGVANMGGNGGAGGAGGTGSAWGGGAAGTGITVTKLYKCQLLDVSIAYTGLGSVPCSNGGGGGGGGGGDNVNSGGGGGGGGTGGGGVVIYSPTITNNATITANGGNGGNGANGVAGNTGGGGGGGSGSGGIIYLVYSTAYTAGTLTVAAGSVGAKGLLSGTGSDGNNGNAGGAGHITVIDASAGTITLT